MQTNITDTRITRLWLFKIIFNKKHVYLHNCMSIEYPKEYVQKKKNIYTQMSHESKDNHTHMHKRCIACLFRSRNRIPTTAPVIKANPKGPQPAIGIHTQCGSMPQHNILLHQGSAEPMLGKIANPNRVQTLIGGSMWMPNRYVYVGKWNIEPPFLHSAQLHSCTNPYLHSHTYVDSHAPAVFWTIFALSMIANTFCISSWSRSGTFFSYVIGSICVCNNILQTGNYDIII